MATSQDRRAARAEILAQYALETSRLAADTGDEELLKRAEGMARETKRVVAELPGRPPWQAQADAALATIAMAQGDRPGALKHARAALGERRDAVREDPHLEILLPAARVILAAGEETEIVELRDELQLLQALIGQRTLDSDVRAKWFKARTGRDLAELAGSPAASAAMEGAAAGAAVDGDAADGADDSARRSASGCRRKFLLNRFVACARIRREPAARSGPDSGIVS